MQSNNLSVNDTIMSKESDISYGREVLAQEIEGLKELSESLGEEFVQTVETIISIKGRVITTGMGKSGHIARKIAATMASTGTPAHFVHPAEASHGDMGMITKDDVVMAFSNSGETAELADMIAYCRRFFIPLIGIARRKSSMLVEAADIAMVLPATAEACVTGAPTTSTTMMLALGDAISVALVQRRGFNKNDFSIFHPGGKLGKAFIRVVDLMHGGEELPLAGENDIMRDVILVMTSKRFGCVGITGRNEKLLGIITDGDLRRHMQPDLLNKKAVEIMKESPITIRSQALAAEALAIMNKRAITSLFVTDKEKPVGIIHIHDCLRAGVA